jgi:prevent-host-death family protein
MTTITQTELRNHIREYVKRAEEGEELQITKNGKPVVKIVAVREAEAPSWKRETPTIKLPKGASAAQLIIDERNEGW